MRRVPHPSDARTTLAVITPRGEKVATEATRDLNETVYECIGLSEPKRGRLVDLLAELRASGDEFDVEHSDEVDRGGRIPPHEEARPLRPVRGRLTLVRGPGPHGVGDDNRSLSCGCTGATRAPASFPMTPQTVP